MKRFISIMLVLVLCGSFTMLFACKKDTAPRGPTDVDYGTVKYIDYTGEPNFTFKYLDCFVRSSDEGDTFVGKTKDDNGVLMFEIGTLSESRPYDAIKEYNQEQVQNMLMIALGLVESQGAEREVTALTFTPSDDHIFMEMSVTSTFKQSGEIQGDYILKYILADGTVYTLHAFVPISSTEKYGVPFKDAMYTGGQGSTPTEPPSTQLPHPEEGYSLYDNGTISFLYSDAFSATIGDTTALGIAQQGMGLMGYEQGNLKEGLEYSELTKLSDDELAVYLAGITGLTATNVISVDSTQLGGYVRLDMTFEMVGDNTTFHCIVTQFVLPDGSTHNVIGYINPDTMAELGVPVKAIEFNPAG